MVNLLNIFHLHESTKFVLLFVMLFLMLLLSIAMLLFNAGPRTKTTTIKLEGFDTVNLQFETTIEVPADYKMSDVDRQNGYYMVKNTNPDTYLQNPYLKVKLPDGY